MALVSQAFLVCSKIYRYQNKTSTGTGCTIRLFPEVFCIHNFDGAYIGIV
jgi:hypothetical protein